MQSASKAKLSLEERTYRALQEIAHRSARTATEPDEDMLLDAIVNWTTDEVHREGTCIIPDDDEIDPTNFADSDLPRLFNFVVLHINAQQSAQHQLAQAEQIIAGIEGDIDTDKLSQQDEGEWRKLFSELLSTHAGEEGPALEWDDDESFDLEAALAASGEAPKEGTAEEVIRGALVEKVDMQAQASMIMGEYLLAIVNKERAKAHTIIDQFGCGLTHALTNLLFGWIESRQMLPESLSLAEWAESVMEMGEHAAHLSSEEKIELARHFMEHEEDDD